MQILKQTILLFTVLFFPLVSQGQNKPDWRVLSNQKGATLDKVQAEFYQYWTGKTIQKGQDYKTFKRWEYWQKPRVFPSGDLSLLSTNYERFIQWQKRNPVVSRSPSGDWKAVGPFAKPLGYDAGVGLVKFICFDPNNVNIIYVGAPDGGLWKSSNGGDFWTLLNVEFLPILACSDLAIDPLNTQIMYLATGNWDMGKKSIGILKSTDGGNSWSPTALSWTVADNYVITKLVMDPNNPSTMMVSTDGGVFRTTDAWASFSNPLCCDHLDDIILKPGDANTVYAAGSTAWKSDDNGATWAQMTDGFPDESEVIRTVLGVSPADPNYLYALTGNQDGGYLGLYLSTDSGESFSLQSDSPNLLNSEKDASGIGGQASHDLAMAISPTDKLLVTIGGINQWQSTDGGETWDIVAYWLGNDNAYPGEGDASPDYVHADIQYLAYQPGSNSVLFAACDGGISKSTNNGANWTDISHNLSIAQQYCVALSASTPDVMVTGLQDIGTIKKAGTTWSVINGGDGLDAFIDRTSDNIIVTSNPTGNHALSFDGGTTRNDITGLPAGEWFSPISQDPGNADLVYAGGREKMWKTFDLFSVGADCDWTEVGAPAGSYNILQFEVAASNNDIIYAIKADAISKSSDAGETWTDLTGNLPVNEASLSDVSVSNTDPLKAWITFSGYSDGNKVFQTIDGGTNWINLSSGLPNLPITTIVSVHNSLENEVYVGADIGVFYKKSTHPDFIPFFTNLPKAMVTDLEIFYPGNLIRASTYGRGTWESDLYSPSIGFNTPVVNDLISVVPNPASNVIEIKGLTAENAVFQVTDAAGKVLMSQKMTANKCINIDHLPKGTYFIEISSQSKRLATKQFIKQ